MEAILQEQGATVVTGVKITSVVREGDRRVVTFHHAGGSRKLRVDEVLVATGRRPNTAGLGLEKAGIELTERGAVKVDECLRTTNPRVWAAGDVTGHPQVVYVAAYEGTLAARDALEKPSFSRIRDTWFATVAGLKNSRRATAVLLRP